MHSALCLFVKLISRRTTCGSAATHAHATATAVHFPANAGLIFLTDKLTNDRYLVDTGATLRIVPCNKNSNPSGPLLKGADGQPIPSWGFISKTVQFQGKLFTSSFLQAAVAGPILGIDFLRKFKVTVSPDINQIQFACTAAASPAPYLLSATSPASPCLFSSPLVQAPFQVQLPAAATSSQPPAISAYDIQNPEVKLSSFSSRKNQSPLDPPPPRLKKYPILCPLMSKFYCKIPLYSSHWGCEADTYPRGRASHPHQQPPPCLYKIPPPRSRKIANRQS